MSNTLPRVHVPQLKFEITPEPAELASSSAVACNQSLADNHPRESGPEPFLSGQKVSSCIHPHYIQYLIQVPNWSDYQSNLRNSVGYLKFGTSFCTFASYR